MTAVQLWLDAQLSPALAPWIASQFEQIQAVAVRDLGLRDAEDLQIFEAACEANAVVMSKDSDFVDLVNRLGPPPKLLWITCGNTSNQRVREMLTLSLVGAVELLQQGESIVEISGE